MNTTNTNTVQSCPDFVICKLPSFESFTNDIKKFATPVSVN